MSSKALESVLNQLKATAAMVNEPAAKSSTMAGTDFAATLRSAIDTVNQQQQIATGLSNAVAGGNSEINISRVMVALEKADLSFQAMVEVRNKLVSAYQEIMNLQV